MMLPLATIALLATTPGVPAPPASPGAAGPVTLELKPEQMLVVAGRMVEHGDVGQGEAIYRTLVRHDRGAVRNEARFRLAELLAKRGDRSGAALLLRDLVSERPEASAARFAYAQLLMAMGEDAAARRELRALGTDPHLPAEITRQIDRWSTTLTRNRPLGIDLSLALAPDTNINRATRSDTLGTVLGDFAIEDDSKARSGLGLAVTGQAFARHSLSGKARIGARVLGSANLYRPKEFRDVGIEVAAGPEVMLGRLRLGLEGGIGKRWYGGRALANSKRVSLDAALPVGPRTQLRAGGDLTRLDNHFNDLQDATSRTAKVGIDHAFGPAMGVSTTISFNRNHAADPAYSTRQWQGDLVAWRDFGSLLVSAGGSIGHLKADARLSLLREARVDDRRVLQVSLTPRRVRWHGFAPSLRLSREWNRSTVEFYDYQRTRGEVAITRAF